MTEFDEIRGRLEQAIKEARNLDIKPPNEACTCEWVIRPLLESAGYAKHEIVSQSGMPGGGFPDYTILPDTQWTWYLEAKTWDKNLENGADAVQALNYANAQGKRWVVLSNGRQWLLFDNHMKEVEAPQRLVARAELRDEGFLGFMLALSKPSITADKLEQYVIRSRVRSELAKQLRNPNSEVIKAITSVLKKLGIAGVQTSDVAEYFSPTSDTDVQPPPKKIYTLPELLAISSKLSSRTQPEELMFPDGSSARLRLWADLAHQVVQWLAKGGKIPELPFHGCPRSRRWFISRDQYQVGGKQHSTRLVEAAGETLYVEVACWSPRNYLENLLALCEAVGEPASGFVVKLKKPPSSE
ncbi:MAG: hypothetical protein QHI38_10565 [Armatimonadota bacterium]|nr:hypothetical protein [Armatimonadota bacterium]